jgi:hypothetical protein
MGSPSSIIASKSKRWSKPDQGFLKTWSRTNARHARRERTEATSYVEENLVNEEMDMDELLNNWKTQKKTKIN